MLADRLRRCLDAGSVAALFPLLADWPRAELVALLDDVERLETDGEAAIREDYGRLALAPANFLSTSRSVALDADKARMETDLVGMLSEISSVACFYLAEREGQDGAAGGKETER